MRAILIFTSIAIGLALISLFFLTEITTGFMERIWHNWIFVKEASVQGDLPLVATGKQARFYLKYEYTWNNGHSKTSEWGASPRKTSNVIQTANRIFDFLNRSAPAQNWPGLGERKIAPFRFFIVSLDPDIILMQPVPALPKIWEKQRQTREANPGSSDPGPWDKWLESIPEPKLETPFLFNPVEYGTRLPPGSAWEWFSSELNQPPQILTFMEPGKAAIRWEGGEIILSSDSKGWQIERR